MWWCQFRNLDLRAILAGLRSRHCSCARSREEKAAFDIASDAVVAFRPFLVALAFLSASKRLACFPGKERESEGLAHKEPRRERERRGGGSAYFHPVVFTAIAA